jgi:hypothetical protein
MNNPADKVCIIHKIVRYTTNNTKGLQDLRKINKSWNDTISNFYCDKWIKKIQNNYKSEKFVRKYNYKCGYNYYPIDVFENLKELNLGFLENYNIIIKTKTFEGYRIGVYKFNHYDKLRIRSDKYITEFLDGPEIFITSNPDVISKEKNIQITEYKFYKNNIRIGIAIKLNLKSFTTIEYSCDNCVHKGFLDNYNKKFLENINNNIFNENIYPSLIKIFKSKYGFDVMIVPKEEFEENKI